MRRTIFVLFSVLFTFLHVSLASAANLEEVRQRLDKFFYVRHIGNNGTTLDDENVAAGAALLATALENTKVDREILASRLRFGGGVYVMPKDQLETKVDLRMRAMIREDATLEDFEKAFQEIEAGAMEKVEGDDQVTRTLTEMPYLSLAISAIAQARGGSVKVDRIDIVTTNRGVNQSPSTVKGSLTGSLLVNGESKALKLKFGPLQRVYNGGAQFKETFQLEIGD